MKNDINNARQFKLCLYAKLCKYIDFIILFTYKVYLNISVCSKVRKDCLKSTENENILLATRYC